MSKTKKNVFIIGIILSFLISCGYVVGLYKNTQFTKKYTSIKGSKANDYVFNIDQLKVDQDNIIINGWFLFKNKASSNHTMYIYMRNNETGDYLKLPTNITLRNDIADIYKNVDHKYSGFYSVSKLKEFNLKTDYSIILVYTDRDDSYKAVLKDHLKVGNIYG